MRDFVWFWICIMGGLISFFACMPPLLYAFDKWSAYWGLVACQ
jgi:hypothetical protein